MTRSFYAQCRQCERRHADYNECETEFLAAAKARREKEEPASGALIADTPRSWAKTLDPSKTA